MVEEHRKEWRAAAEKMNRKALIDMVVALQDGNANLASENIEQVGVLTKQERDAIAQASKIKRLIEEVYALRDLVRVYTNWRSPGTMMEDDQPDVR